MLNVGVKCSLDLRGMKQFEVGRHDITRNQESSLISLLENYSKLQNLFFQKMTPSLISDYSTRTRTLTGWNAGGALHFCM